MKRPKSIEDQLREKLPPMRSSFRTELRAQLYQKTEHKNKRSSSFIFTFLFNNMKRYSLGYLAALLIAVLSFTTIFKTPLSAQEVLANALENYKPTGDIFHEKIETSYYKDGKKIESFTNDYYQSEAGDYLNINTPNFNANSSKNPIVFLQRESQFGDTYTYFSDTGKEKDVDFSEYPEDRKLWLEKFEGEKIYCVNEVITQNGTAHAFLTFAADDHSTYLVNGSGPSQGVSSEGDFDKMMNLKNVSADSNAKNYIQDLMKQDSHEFLEITQEGKRYYVFELSDTFVDRPVKFYIDAENYNLAQYEFYTYGNPEVIEEKYVILKSEYLQEEDHKDLFDPNRFEGLLQSRDFTVPDSSKFKESGCFDYEMNKISDDILTDLPKKAIDQWKEVENSLLNTDEKSNESSTQTERKIVDVMEKQKLPFDPQSVQMPAKTAMTQGFHGSHDGWDFAPASGQDSTVYVPKDGKVIQVDKNGYNGGYGNFVLVQHSLAGKEVITRYAHLAEINVTVNQQLKEGDVIGKMGTAGRVRGGIQLHFEVIINDEKVDPRILWEE